MVIANKNEMNLPQRQIARSVERLAEVDAPKAMLAHEYTHFIKGKIASIHELHFEIVGLNHDEIRFSQRLRCAFEHVKFDAMRVKFQKVWPWQIELFNQRVDFPERRGVGVFASRRF